MAVISLFAEGEQTSIDGYVGEDSEPRHHLLVSATQLGPQHSLLHKPVHTLIIDGGPESLAARPAYSLA